VASGGGLKAYAFHAGVLRALEENGFRRRLAWMPRLPAQQRADGSIEITTYIGSSAGACIAAACAFFASMDDTEGVIGLRPTKVPRFGYGALFRPHAGWYNLRERAGLFSADGVEAYFRERATCNDFRLIGPEIYICATQLNGSRKVVFGPRDSSVNGQYDRFIAYYNDVPISQAVAASVSVPGLYRPFPIRNQRSGETFEYIDGEVRETLSVHVARDKQVPLVVVSNVWMPYHYDPKIGSVSAMGVPMILTQTITQMVEQKVDRLRNEYDRYGEAVELVREFGRAEGLADDLVERLIKAISATLRYFPMDEIYIVPDRHDSEFTLMPSWSFKRQHLELALSRGYQRAIRAIAAWKAQHASRAAAAAGTTTAANRR
jgi:predicted acylesterase/phospholipase RssA